MVLVRGGGRWDGRVTFKDCGMTKSTVLKWHGGKAYLADWIIGHFPARCKNPNSPAPDDSGWLHYVEPYFGGGSVLFANDPTGISEVANDLNFQLSNFWYVLADVDMFHRFKRIVDAMPFSGAMWDKAKEHQTEDCIQAGMGVAIDKTWSSEMLVEAATSFFVHCRQSMSGRMASFAPLTRNRTRQGMNEQVSAWLSCVEGLPEAHGRMRRVAVLNMPAVKVIRQQDGPRVLHYLDPPYLHKTRKTTKEYGKHEMSDDDHRELLETLTQIKGRFILSGYPSKLYDEFAKRHGWNTDVKRIDNKSSKAADKELKDETLWMNF